MSFITFKPSVNPVGVHPTIWIALGVAHASRQGLRFTDPNTTVTSLKDGAHMQGSLHYSGKAIDVRTHDLHPDDKHLFTLRVANLLNPLGFDVVFHDGSQPGIPEHLHIEYQPKAGETWRVPGFA